MHFQTHHYQGKCYYDVLVSNFVIVISLFFFFNDICERSLLTKNFGSTFAPVYIIISLLPVMNSQLFKFISMTKRSIYELNEFT